MSNSARPRYATKAAIARAVQAWRALGKEPDAIELAPDGTIRLTRAPQRETDEWQSLAKSARA